MDDSELNSIYALKHSGILIHQSQLGPRLVSHVIKECTDSENWHKFVVGNVETYKPDFILRTIIDYVNPSEFFPIYFSRRKRAFFLARNCLEAILKLISNKLVIPNPLHPDKPFRIVIIANQIPSHMVKTDFSASIISVLQKRLNNNKKILNLNSFHEDPDLKQFCLLSLPKLMLYVMQLITELNPVPEKIELKGNFIKVLEPLRLLATYNLRAIDLRNNEIATVEDLEPLKDFKQLRILKLDGNPLCGIYSNYNYVLKLKQICPSLHMIDGLNVFNKAGVLMAKKNFLCDLAGGDLVSQFIEYFFTAYDFEDRTKIVDLYHKKAIFTVTSRIIPNQTTTKTARLNHYLTISRNLRSPTNCFSNKDNYHKFVYKGTSNIMKLFKELPRTLHDPLQFQCDLIYYTGARAVLVVHGIFQEGSEKIGFTRNFVLQRDKDDAYSIVNDQLHVFNALNHQLQFSYRYPQNVNYTYKPLPYYNRQFWELKEAVQEITGLNYDYCQRFLEIFHYDLKRLLNNFVRLHINDKIPPEAFIEPRKAPMLDPASKKKPALPENVKLQTEAKCNVVTLNTVWMTVNEKRLCATLQPELSDSEILNMLNEYNEQSVQQSDNQLEVSSGSIQGNDNQQPGTSKGSGSTSGIPAVPAEQEGPDESVANIIKKLNMFKEQRKKALQLKKQIKRKAAASKPVEGTSLDPDAYLQMFKDPKQLGIGTNKVVTEIIVKSLSEGQPYKGPTGRKKKNKNEGKKKKKRNPCNINVIKQEYYFTQ